MRAHRADGGHEHVVPDVVAVLVVDRLEGVEVEDADRERVPVTPGAADHAGQLGEDRAPVEQPGQRVLAQQRLEPPALGYELVLEILGAAGRLHAGDDLAVGHRLDQEVDDAPPQAPGRRGGIEPVRRHHHDRGAVHVRIGLDLGDQAVADPIVQDRHVGMLGAAADERGGRVGGLAHLMAGVGQHAHEATAVLGVRMDHEDAHLESRITPVL